MSFESISSVVSSTTPAYTGQKSNTKNTTKSTSSAANNNSSGVIYEKSSDTDTKKTTYSATKNKVDHAAIVAQMKADTEARTNQLQLLVKEMMQKQGKTYGTANDIWSFLASGDYTVTEAAKTKAQEEISEDGYWGVNQTSDRIVSFAIALSGNDTSKAELLVDAFKKGYSQATKYWGKDLPDISSKTYDAVIEKFDKWIKGDYPATETTETEA